ncbi:MAG: peptidase domain-containing ABC transporter [Oscillospiraceae bacterium]|nr:peptidase domain-containing ABC transporter [Oscillospiraceae bacterium]
MRVNRYKCVRQYDATDCGVACLATIAQHYGLKIPVTRIREIAGTDKQGTNIYGMIKAAELLGFNAKGVKPSVGEGDGNIQSKREVLSSPFSLPAIAHTLVDGSMSHYVVIHKITKKQIIIADPAKGLKKVTIDEFMSEWTGVLVLLVPTHEFEKGDHTKGIYAQFFKLIIPQRGLLINVFFVSLLFTVLGIGAAFYFRIMMDDILPNMLERSLTVVSIGVIALYVFQHMLSAFRNHMLLHMSQKLDVNLILGYYHHVLELPMSFFGTRRVGEIITRFMDASKIREAITGASLTIMIDTIMAAVGGIILYMQSPQMFVVAVAIVFLYGIIVFSFNKPLRDINEKYMEENAQLMSYLVESLNGIETVKAFNSERSTKIETEKRFVRFLRAVFKFGWLQNMSGSMSGLVAAVGGVVILWVGALSVMRGDMTIGGLLTFNALLVYFLDPVRNLIDLQPKMQTAIVASNRLGEILDLELEKTEKENKKIALKSLLKPIKFENIDFRYSTRRLVLQDISLSIASGEKIALVGESGSGKTTLAKLLLNFYPWEKGDISIGEFSIEDLNIEALREKIAYISQDVFLFSGTIYENLTLGMDYPDMEEVVRVASMTQAHDFISDFPLRYETQLEENGANLSGGQKQRLAITRALLKKPDILIMDEATSNLDSITEKAISRMIDEQTSGITTIIIAHRLSTIMRCDKIYLMDEGKIEEAGSHMELMDAKGRYYELWREQIPDLDGVTG